jgi:hypothetical protein
MLKRSSKELGELAAELVLADMAQSLAASRGKNPAAVALGRRGGLKGGKARAQSLSKARRSEIARQAAEARWKANTH